MTPLFLSLLLQAAPTVELGDRSDCADELREAFRESEYALQPEGEVELTLVHAPKNELTARRDGVVALRRELGAGTCGEASRAAVVIVGRWLTSLPASTWKGPRKKTRDAGVSDARVDGGAPDVRNPGSGGFSDARADTDARNKRGDAGAADARSTGGSPRADARNTRGDAGATDARNPGTDARAGADAGDARGSSDGRVGTSDVRASTDARRTRADARSTQADAGAADARNPGFSDGRAGATDARASTDARNTRPDGGAADARAGTDPRNTRADAGVADARIPGFSDGRAGATDARASTDARNTRPDGGAADARAGTDPRNTRADAGVADARSPGSSSDTSAGADARNTRADAGAADARSPGGSSDTSAGADARNMRADGGASDARNAGADPARSGGASDAGSGTAGTTTTLSGIELTSTGSGLAGDAGVSLNSRLSLTTPDAGTEAEPVISRIGIEPPTSDPPPPPPQTTPFRVEITHLEALAGGGIGLPGTPDAVSPVISLELAITFNHRLRIGALGAFDFGGGTNVLDERSQVRGRLNTFGFVAAPTVTACLDTAVRLCGGALLGTRVAQGTTSGSFIFGTENQRSAWSAAFTVGPTVQATLIVARFHLALDASLLVTPAPPQFQVMGLPTVLSWPVAQGLIRLSLGFGSL